MRNFKIGDEIKVIAEGTRRTFYKKDELEGTHIISKVTKSANLRGIYEITIKGEGRIVFSEDIELIDSKVYWP